MKSLRIYLTFIGLLFLLSIVVSCMAQKTTSNGDSQKNAKKLWEQAVAAKGGRERLYSIRNLVVSSRANYMHGFKKYQIRQEALYVFPNKLWWWNDMRPDVFGLRMEMYNFDSRMKYIVQLGDPRTELEPIEKNESREFSFHRLAPLLLETEWLKPVLVEASIEKIGLRRVNIIQTMIDRERVDFAFDQKTHLLVRVSYYNLINNKTYITKVDYSDYFEVDGIQMPQTEKADDGTTYKQSYQFNIEYDDSIFIKAPPIESGPELWRAKRIVE